MADSPIGSLPAVLDIYDADYFVLEQNGVAKKLTGRKLSQYIDRQITDVTVTQLQAGATPTVTYNRITGTLNLGLPKANGITAVRQNTSTYQLTFVWEDGTTVDVGTVKGETGKSAYQYAQENGYTGSETDYGEMMVTLYNAAENEEERVQNEARRVEDYQYILDSTQEQLDKFAGLMEYADSVVVDTTLFMYRGGVVINNTTLML